MTQQGNKPPVRRLDASGLTGQAPSASARQLPVERQAPRAERHEFRARPIEDYVRDAGNTVDEGQDDYDAGPVQPIGEPPAVPAPRVTQASGAYPDENAVVFTRAYTAHGEDVRRVTFRRPVTRDIRKIGNPLVLETHPDGSVTVKEINLERVAQYVEVLAEPPLPPSTINQLDYFDLDACSAVIGRFFVRLA